MATSFLDSAEDNAALINIISGKYAMASYSSKRRAKIIKNLASTWWRRFSETPGGVRHEIRPIRMRHL